MQRLNPQDLRQTLRTRLRGAERITVLGIGSELRGDDAAGIAVARALLEKPRRSASILIGATAPENLTGELKRHRPTHLVIVDAADLSDAPGTIADIGVEESEGISFSTHTLPIGVFVSYLREHFPFEVLILGVQPKTLEFAAPLSEEVGKSAQVIVEALREIL